MPDFRVVAKRYRESVEFLITDATDAKDALDTARKEANRIFDYDGKQGDPPTVIVKLEEEK